MSDSVLHGLIESPYHKGWIEFEYEPGDRVSDLAESIKNQWGKPSQAYDSFQLQPKSWAIFCEGTDGTYVALRQNDYIPIRDVPAGSVEIPASDFFASHAFLPYPPGLLDVFFLRKYWKIKGEEPREPKENYLMRLSFKRDYELPSGKEYACRLLALVAIVGG